MVHDHPVMGMKMHKRKPRALIRGLNCDNIKPMRISAVIITYNEEKRLEAALKSLKDVADEIVVVDRYSDDDTVKLARKYTDRVFLRKWTDFSDQKNYGNGKARFPWILSLDADERLSPGLREEILRLKAQEEEPGISGFKIPRRIFYLGRWVRHTAWNPDLKIRLFRHQKARWEGKYVHEDLTIQGEVKKLKEPLYHFTYRNIADHLRRMNTFSDLGAQKLYSKNTKCRWYHMALFPFFRFIKSYFFKAGFLDGFAGFVISVLFGYSGFVTYAKLKEIWKRGEKIEPCPN
jgi:glycosyltransferase involved in cell wall biosynthesis